MKKVLTQAVVSTATIYRGTGSMPMDQRLPMFVATSLPLMGTLRLLRGE